MDKNQALDAVFNLESVAIVGVAPGQGYNSGRLFLEHILEYGFKGRVYPVNPKGGEIHGLKIYPNLKDIAGPVDYVISCIPARLVPQLLRDAALKRVKAVGMFTSGFSELNTREGRELERETIEVARATGVRIIGPNCLGIHSPKAGFSYAPDFPRETGHVSFLCQSGGQSAYLVRAAAARGIRFNKVISYGNGADIDETDLIRYFQQDPDTRIIAAYIEGVRGGRRFYDALRETAPSKPVVIVKGGRTPAGSIAVASHTASLAGSTRVWRDMMRQAGAISADSMDEVADMLVTLTYLPRLAGRRVAMVGMGGGAAVLSTDEWEEHGFTLPGLTDRLREAWRGAVGNDAGTILNNPLDIPNLGSAAAVHDALRSLRAFEGIDLLVFHAPLRGMMIPVAATAAIFEEEARTVVKLQQEPGKPLAVVLHSQANSAGWAMSDNQAKTYYEAGLPVYYSAASAAKAINRFLWYTAKFSGAGASAD
jgi:acyl-CoA synthetase (NDP forming)